MALELIIDRIIDREGEEFTNDSMDSGGPTKYGITAESLGRFRGYPQPATAEQVEALTLDETRLFYRWYLRGAEALQLPDLLSEPFADVATMSGQAEAIKTVQRALRITADGIAGPVTTRTVAEAAPRHLLIDFTKTRAVWLADLVQQRPKDLKFLEGWIARTVNYLDPLKG